ncbi:DUF418 domain-containing protein, partial [Bacillus sp. JJ722]|uniref:DUF418 domain-containing protein n=1 Tax=Bacillus sp. JJ722 TaxID=3122973 RepID=UPI002FFFCFC6
GLAIMGIFLVNIQSFIIEGGQEVLNISKVDEWLYRIIEMFALGKFHFIFAFLFGIGASIFLSRLASKGLSVWTYMRRMLLLLLAGIIHLSMWGGDVLSTYAVMGLLLLVFYRLPLKWIIIFGSFFSFFYDFYSVFHASIRIYDWNLPTTLLNIDTMINNMAQILMLPKTLGHMLLGCAVYRIGLFEKEKYVPAIKKVFFVLFICSIGIWIWSLTITSENFLHAVTFQLAIVPGMMYVLGLILLLRTNFGVKLLSPLQSYGRMAFTNYFMQTIIGITIIKGIVANNTVHATEALLICVVVFIVQILLSNIWLKFFYFGPLEWLWRCGTYLKIQPIKK